MASGGLDHAFLYRKGSMIDLNSLLDASGTGWTLTQATAINNKGQIVGFGIDPLGHMGAFVLTPVRRHEADEAEHRNCVKNCEESD
jgi:hypothetical protein